MATSYIYPDLPGFFDSAELTFAFLNDFVGNGDQSISTWENIGGIIPDRHRTYLIVLAAAEQGIQKIHNPPHV